MGSQWSRYPKGKVITLTRVWGREEKKWVIFGTGLIRKNILPYQNEGKSVSGGGMEKIK